MAEKYRAGRMTKPDEYAALGFDTLVEFDGFLTAHGLYGDYTLAGLDRERQAVDLWTSGYVPVLIADSEPLYDLVLIGETDRLSLLFTTVLLP